MRNLSLLVFSLLFLSVLSTSGRAQEIERVEPPNWWVGFENTELQLLVYGQDIGHLKPVVEYPGVSVKHVVRTENDHYLFLYLNVSPNTRPGKFPIIFTSKGLEVLRHDYELLARKAGAAEVAGFDNTDVMYLITPDRFANGDPENDAVAEMKEGLNREYKGGRHGGDIKGIQDNLDYIVDMGFTAIWVNPVLENNMEQYSYHGYSTTDFYRVDPRFGSNETYRNLGAAAGAKGVKLIMDMILNHCGSNHWFVLDPPTKDWINYGGEYVNTSHRRTTVQDVHASTYDQKRFSDGWFVQTMPDLNQRNPLFGTYLIQNSIWWVEYAGLAGIRMDTYPYSDAAYLSEWSCALMREYPSFSIVGEEWSPQPAIVSYWQAGKENHDGYSSCLPNLMDFPLQEAMRASLAGEHESWNDPWVKLYETLALDFLYPAYDDLVVFPDNHDMARIFTQVDHDYGLWQLALTYVLTTRGIPQVYYGTEILMDSRENPGDHGLIRTDFPGGWAGDAVNAFTGAGLSEEKAAAQQWLKRLLNWRKTASVVHHGKLMQFAPQNKVYVFFRYDEEEKVMVILNRNEDTVELDLSPYTEQLQGISSGTDILTGKAHALADNLQLAGKRAYVLEIE